MFRRSPHKLRSGYKGQAVELSTGDKPRPVRSLSVSSAPDRLTTDNMAGGKSNVVVDPAVIAELVNKHLTSEDVVSSLVDKLMAQLRTVVEEAVRSALSVTSKEVARLGAEVTRLSAAVKEIDERLLERTDELEQYQRRNNVRIFGIEETAGENTDQIVAELCRGKLGVVDLTVEALCRTHRVGRPPKPGPNGEKRHRPIIVRFTSYRDRRLVYESKKKLKGTGIIIREDLTARRLELLQRATAVHGVRSTWTQDGRVLWIDSDGTRGAATRLADLPTTQ